MRKLIAGIILVCYSFSAYAADDAKYLKKDEPAPFTGYLITPEKADKIRLMDIDLTSSKRIIELHVQENAILNDRLANTVEHNKMLREAVVNKSSFWNDIGMFLAGSVVTMGIAWGVTRATK